MRFSENGRWIAVGLLVWLAASGAALAEDGTLRGLVRDAESTDPLSRATVLVVDTQASTTTATDGSYFLSLPPGDYMVLATAPGHRSREQRVTIEAGETATLDFQLSVIISQFGEELVVLGSRSQRTAVETPVPVDVLGPTDIQEMPQPETSRMIQFLAPSFNFSTSTISDGTDIVRPSTLRGLGPDQTLVLVNGKRRHNSALVHVNGSIGRGTAGVDLNAIPASAIERIEILRDGAAAQYGSDAIAGVINVILKRQAEGTSINLSGGQHFAGDGELFQASITHGWTVRENGFFNVSAEVRNRDSTNRAGDDPRRIFNFQEQVFGQPALTDSDGDGTCDQGGPCTPDPREDTYQRLNHRYGDAESENLYLFVNSEIPIRDDLDFYFFGGFSDRDGESAGFNRLPSQSRTNILIHPEGFLPLINTEVNDLSLAGGVRKTFGNWSLDASLTTGMNEFEFIISNSANTSLGAASPTEANAGTLSFGQTTLNVDLYGALDWGRGAPIIVAVGAEVRQDDYEIEAGQPESWVDGCADDTDAFPCATDQFGGRAPAGIQVFPGFRPENEVDESRENYALYGDIEIAPSDKFLLGLAARFEDYSDFGNNVSGKIAGRYEITEDFALRGSFSSGFRAPSLHQSNFNNISTQFVGVPVMPLEVGTFRIGSDVANALGAEPLEEETSINYSFGFTAKPMENLLVTTDVYKIDIDDRIVISGQFRASNPAIEPLLEPFDVNAAQFFTNAIDTETEGVDLVVAWTKNLGNKSRLSLTGSANWTETEVVGDVRTPAPLAGFGETLFDRKERAFVERGQPREHYNFSARYSRGPFAVLGRLNKFGAVVTVEDASNPGIDQTFTGKWIADLDFSYKFANGMRLAIGANNIFDEFPDKNRDEIDFNGIFVYPRRTAPFGFNGGYWYTRLGFEF